MTREAEIRHWHACAGLGGGAKGFQAGQARVGNVRARFRCIGGFDVDAAAARDFERLTGTRCAVLDAFSREQYRHWHGTEPPADWREVTPADIRASAGGERPHIVFTSPPCKGFSGLQSERRAGTPKYLALNELALRTIWLILEAWPDDPPEFILLENVPRIATRGRHLLDQIDALLARYGYAMHGASHDCGRIGNLAQSRKRHLIVARHQAKVPPFLYQPRNRPLRAVGTLLGRMPLPGQGDNAGGPMHRLPALHWKTWVRLALVEAGSDWRSLQRLAITDGVLRDYVIVPDMHHGVLGVNHWHEPSGTVTGNARPGTGNFAVADPRLNGERHTNIYRVVRWDEVGKTVTSGPHPSNGAISVADPRCQWSESAHRNKLRVSKWDAAAPTVTGCRGPASGALVIADPRPGLQRRAGDAYLTAGHYGVVPWTEPAGAVTGSARHDNGPGNVADPRLPEPGDRLTCAIRSLDGTWHRPFTTLELAALQSLIEPEEQLELDGLSDSAWRERIGNAVPPAAAAAVASVMGETLLAAWAGETFHLDTRPIWVRPLAAAIALPGAQP